MKLFNVKNNIAMAAVLGLTIGAGAAQAWETETDTIKIMAISSQLAVDPGYAIMMSTPDSLGTGRCTDDVINAALDGGSSQAMFDALVAANNAGRTVTVYYQLELDNSCNLAYVIVN